MDIKGANVFLEHLSKNSPTQMLTNGLHMHQQSMKEKSQQPVESILVCTGVYNPQNDLLFHVRKLFGNKSSTKKSSSHRSHQVVDDHESMTTRNDDERVITRGDSIDSSRSSSSMGNSDNSASDEDEDERLIERPREQSEQFNENELAQALSNKNSFISYFEDKLNIPDHTFENLRHSVEYIIKQSRRGAV